MKTIISFMLLAILSLGSITPTFALTEEEKATPTPESPLVINESPTAEKLDINTASMQELLLIPGLGEEQVLAILNERPYTTMAELLEIPGIDKALLDIMGNLITVIPQTQETPAPGPTLEEPEQQEDGKININTASLQELLSLPGLGKKRVQAIIDGRPYETVDDLLDVPGIDEKRLAKIREMITVTPVEEELEELEEDQKKAEEKQREDEKREEERQREDEKREEERQREDEKREEERQREDEKRK